MKTDNELKNKGSIFFIQKNTSRIYKMHKNFNCYKSPSLLKMIKYMYLHCFTLLLLQNNTAESLVSM